MLASIIHWSLRNRLLVIGLWFILAAAGLYAMSVLPIDAFPDTTPVQVQINTVAPSLVPLEIERQITFPIEMALSGLPRLQQVRSTSQFGLSQVIVTFEDGTDVYFARQLINERLGTVELPEGLEVRPEMGPVSTGLGEVFQFYLRRQGTPNSPAAAERRLTELRTTEDWVLRPALRPTRGTAEINSWGGLKKQYQIRVDPRQLIKFDLTFGDVTRTVAENNLNVGGGNIDEAGGMLLVHGIARPTNVDQISNLVVKAHEGVPIRIRDIAEVVVGHEIRRGAVTADGQGEVVLGLGFMLMGENSYKVTRRLSDRLEGAKSLLLGDEEVVVVYDRTELVDHVIETVKNNLCEGGLLVFAILFIFLGNLRAGLIVGLAIPLSLLFAFSGMLRFGIAASLLSLGALDFGLVVDSSVVMVENAVARLASSQGANRNRDSIIGNACAEVARPSVFGTLIILIVYLPILALEGVEGKLFRPMALTVIFALVGSLVLSLTLIPVLSTYGLPRGSSGNEPWPARLMLRLYDPALRTAQRHPLLVLLAAVSSLVVAFCLAATLGSEFVPRLNEGAIVVGIVRMPGTSVEESVRLNTRMEQMILAEFPDEVEHVWCRAGAPEVATDASTVEMTDFFITLTPRSQWKRAHSQAELVGQFDQNLRDIPGQNIWFTQPIEQRINEMISGSRADLALKVFGPDFGTLLSKAAEIEQALRETPGSADLAVEQVLGQPVLQVRVRPDDIARYDVPAQAVLDIVEAVGGKPVGEIMEEQLRFPLAIRLADDYRKSASAVAALLVPTASGERIPLERLADVKLIEGARVISREWGERRVIVQCNIRGRDMGHFVSEAQARIAPIAASLPTGYRVEWGGQFENLERASRRLAIVIPVALTLILLMLYVTFQNLFDSALVFASVPFACVGGVASLVLRDMPFSISAAVGFIALAGISVLNSLVLVECIHQLKAEGLPLGEAVEQAGRRRLRPVLMTALVASLGFVPMAFSTGMGAEVQRPLATVVIGGVISCTLMTLLVLPVLYAHIGALIARRRPPVPA